MQPGAAAAIARLNAAGTPVIVVTNQAGIARGSISWEEYRAQAKRIDQLLALEGARLDATYVCPHAPEVDGPCPCRKPEIALFVQAAEEHGVDLAASVWAGDRLSDLLPARRFGGSGVLVLTGNGPSNREPAAELGFPAVAGLGDVVDRILGRAG